MRAVLGDAVWLRVSGLLGYTAVDLAAPPKHVALNLERTYETIREHAESNGDGFRGALLATLTSMTEPPLADAVRAVTYRSGAEDTLANLDPQVVERTLGRLNLMPMGIAPAQGAIGVLVGLCLDPPRRDLTREQGLEFLERVESLQVQMTLVAMVLLVARTANNCAVHSGCWATMDPGALRSRVRGLVGAPSTIPGERPDGSEDVATRLVLRETVVASAQEVRHDGELARVVARASVVVVETYARRLEGFVKENKDPLEALRKFVNEQAPRQLTQEEKRLAKNLMGASSEEESAEATTG